MRRAALTRSAQLRDVFDVPRELRLLPLLAGIGVLFAVGIFAFVGAVSLAGRQADQIVARDSRDQVARVLAAQTMALSTLSADWACGNEAHAKLALAPDRIHAHAPLG